MLEMKKNNAHLMEVKSDIQNTYLDFHHIESNEQNLYNFFTFQDLRK